MTKNNCKLPIYESHITAHITFTATIYENTVFGQLKSEVILIMQIIMQN